MVRVSHMSATSCPFGGCPVCEEGLVAYQTINCNRRRIRHMLREQNSLTISDDHGLLAKLVGVTMNYVEYEGVA